MRQIALKVAPVAEQRRVVAEIEKQFTRLDAAVATLEGVRTKLKWARASVLKAAGEGRLVPTEAELARQQSRSYEPAPALLARLLEERRRRWPAGKKYSPPIEPDCSSLPTPPEGWAWSALDQLLTEDLRNGKSARESETGTVIATAAIPLPPLAEQQRIVAEVERRLSVLDTLERTVEQNLIRCAHLRQSILKRAFEGRLVPQDPTDEPAAALLARLRTSGESTGPRASRQVK